jgi:putative ABC transport system substrate-binding protein
LKQEVAPNTKVIAALFNPANPSNFPYVEKLQAVAGKVGITVRPFELRSPDALDAVFSTIVSRDAAALHIVADSGVWDLNDRIAALALAQGLPSFTTLPKYAQLGGLIDYGAFPFRRACSFVSRILGEQTPAICRWSSQRESN